MLAAPEDFGAAFAAAWTARDAGALASLFSDNADFVNVVGLWWQNRGAIEKAHRHAFDTFFARSRLICGKTAVRPLGRDAAVVHQRLILAGQITPDGAPTGRRATILCAVLERHEKGWIAVAAQNTEVIANAETFLSGASGPRPENYRAPLSRD